MPKKPIDYSKALIYSIVCKTDPSLLYIGSTTDFRIRKNLHKSNTTNEATNKYNYQVYQTIRANGGWCNFEMTKVKDFFCENREQLVTEEERLRKEMNAVLCNRRAFSTKEDKKVPDPEAEKIRKHNSYLANRDPVKEKEYREANRDQVKERKRKCYLAKREYYLEKMKEYHLAKKNIST